MLVGHSYGGAVITNVAADAGEIVALVYVGAFAPDEGEAPSSCRSASRAARSARRSGRSRADGSVDLVIDHDRFHAQFCSDLPKPEAGLMAATQRPIAQAALEEPAGADPLWKRLPSFFLIGGEDRNIPRALQHSLAERAGARRTIELYGCSHAVAVSHPDETAGLILEAAHLTTAAV